MTNKIEFRMNGTVYSANKALTSCYKWPEGFKGQRVHIKRAEMLEAMVAFGIKF